MTDGISPYRQDGVAALGDYTSIQATHDSHADQNEVQFLLRGDFEVVDTRREKRRRDSHMVKTILQTSRASRAKVLV